MSAFPLFLNPDVRDIVRPNALPEILNVGLTGGIGSGKSTVAGCLLERGAALVDLDAIAHDLTAAGGLALPMIEASFGRSVFTDEGLLDRAAMRRLIFHEPSHKTKLEHILHPLIFAEAIQRAYRLAESNPICLIYDIPLLAQSAQWQSILDFIVVVDCAVDVRVERIKQRSPQLNEDMIARVMASQASVADMYAIANVVLDNTENKENRLHLNAQVNILAEYLQCSAALARQAKSPS